MISRNIGLHCRLDDTPPLEVVCELCEAILGAAGDFCEHLAASRQDLGGERQTIVEARRAEPVPVTIRRRR